MTPSLVGETLALLPWRTHEQRLPDLFFKRRDSHAYGRLRNMLSPARTGERTGLDYVEIYFQPLQIHIIRLRE